MAGKTRRQDLPEIGKECSPRRRAAASALVDIFIISIS
jgi:hypothetical protein